MMFMKKTITSLIEYKSHGGHALICICIKNPTFKCDFEFDGLMIHILCTLTLVNATKGTSSRELSGGVIVGAIIGVL